METLASCLHSFPPSPKLSLMLPYLNENTESVFSFLMETRKERFLFLPISVRVVSYFMFYKIEILMVYLSLRKTKKECFTVINNVRHNYRKYCEQSTPI